MRHARLSLKENTNLENQSIGRHGNLLAGLNARRSADSYSAILNLQHRAYNPLVAHFDVDLIARLQIVAKHILHGILTMRPNVTW